MKCVSPPSTRWSPFSNRFKIEEDLKHFLPLYASLLEVYNGGLESQIWIPIIMIFMTKSVESIYCSFFSFLTFCHFHFQDQQVLNRFWYYQLSICSLSFQNKRTHCIKCHYTPYLDTDKPLKSSTNKKQYELRWDFADFENWKSIRTVMKTSILIICVHIYLNWLNSLKERSFIEEWRQIDSNWYDTVRI